MKFILILSLLIAISIASQFPSADTHCHIMPHGNITEGTDAWNAAIVPPTSHIYHSPHAADATGNVYLEEYPPNNGMKLNLAINKFQIASTVKVTVRAVDGFGNVRPDWLVEIEGVTSGFGQVTAELIEGRLYTARVSALGFTNVTTFMARGPQMDIAIKIPTAKITAQVVDGFGRIRSDWPLEIVGVTSGTGQIKDVEVLAGQYTVRAMAFNKEFTQTVNVQAGESKTVTINIPTAILSVTVVDDDRKPINNYVTVVEISGPLNMQFSEAPKNIEVLAGQYTIRVIALGKESQDTMSINAGEVVSRVIVVPGTALITTSPPMAWVLAITLALATAAVVLWIARRRIGAGH